MFFSGFNFNMNCCSNPFAMGFMNMNPRLNFFMGLAAGTSGLPMYGMPMGYSLFSNPMFTMPNMNYSSPSVFGYNNFNMGFGMDTFSQMSNIPGYIPRLTYVPQLPSFITNGFGTDFNFNFESQGASDSQDVGGPEGTKLKRDKKQYGPEFLNKVKQIAKRINCNYRDLLAVMNSESGINAQQWCKVKGYENKAVGLIQFTESAAKSLGTTLPALAKMTPIQQLDYVEKYYKMWIKQKNLTGKKLSAGDLYALTYTPNYVNQEVLAVKGQKFYNANAGLDVNKDNKITKTDLAEQVRRKYVSDNTFLA